jgi:hypothetical protein
VPITYSIDPTLGVIRTRCRDFVTLPEVLGHFEELVSDPESPRKLDVLLDLRGVTSVPTAENLQAAGERVREVRPRIEFGACAIVVDTDAMYATAMVFQVTAARNLRASRVFRDLYEAERWLKSQREAAAPRGDA